MVGDGEMVADKLLLGGSGIGVAPTGWVPRADYLRTVSETIDVGVVPLKLDAFNEAKSWLKLLEFSSQGIPAVSSPTSENLELAAITGTPVARKQRDWQRHVARLLREPGLAEEAGESAREAVSHMTYERNGDAWPAAWALAAEIGARRRAGK